MVRPAAASSFFAASWAGRHWRRRAIGPATGRASTLVPAVSNMARPQQLLLDINLRPDETGL
jgi:hypothetical protein